MLRGWLCRKRWVGEGRVRTRVVENSDWDGDSEAGAPFLLDPLDPIAGPTVELVLLPGTRARLVLRTAHAALDGMASLDLLPALCAARRGEPVANSPHPRMDMEVIGPGVGEGVPPQDAVPPMGTPDGEDPLLYRRVTVTEPARPVLARVLLALAQHAHEQTPGPLRFDIPVDLRQRHPGPHGWGNLTGLMAIDIAPDASPEAVAQQVRTAAQEGRAEPRIRGADILRHFPAALVKAGASHAAREHRSRTHFSTTGTVSNLGRVALEDFATPDLTPAALSFIPPGTEVTPLFVGMVGTGQQVRIVLMAPDRFGGKGRLDALAQAVREALSSGTLEA